MTVSGELYCVIALPFAASLGVIVHVHVCCLAFLS